MQAALFVVALVTGLLLHVLSVLAFGDWQGRRAKWRAGFEEWGRSASSEDKIAGYRVQSPGVRHPSFAIFIASAALSYLFAFLVAYVLGTMPA